MILNMHTERHGVKETVDLLTKKKLKKKNVI